MPGPDISESEIPGAGREAREARERYSGKVMLKVGLKTRCLGPGPAATTRIVLSARVQPVCHLTSLANKRPD